MTTPLYTQTTGTADLIELLEHRTDADSPLDDMDVDAIVTILRGRHTDMAREAIQRLYPDD